MNPTLDDRTERIPTVPAGSIPTPAPTLAQLGGADGGRRRTMLTSMFWDVGLAVSCYYGAKGLGFSDYAALLSGTVVTGARLVWVAVRDRRVDPFAMFLMVLFGAGLALAFLTGDARFVLVKDSFTDGLAGLVFLASCLIHRPLTFYAALRFAGSSGADRVNAQWASRPLRRGFYRTSLAWGFGLLADALLRIPLIYLLPLDVAVGATNLLMAIVFGGLTAFTMRMTKRAQTNS